MQTFLVLLIKGYQKTLSLLIGGSCRFYPTCSQYAIEAIETHGSLKGAKLMFARIARCHPGCEGGVDLVPQIEYSNNPNCCKNNKSHSHLNTVNSTGDNHSSNCQTKQLL